MNITNQLKFETLMIRCFGFCPSAIYPASCSGLLGNEQVRLLGSGVFWGGAMGHALLWPEKISHGHRKKLENMVLPWLKHK